MLMALKTNYLCRFFSKCHGFICQKKSALSSVWLKIFGVVRFSEFDTRSGIWVVVLSTFNSCQRLEEIRKRWGASFFFLKSSRKWFLALPCIFTHKLVKSSSRLLSAVTAGYRLKAFHTHACTHTHIHTHTYTHEGQVFRDLGVDRVKEVEGEGFKRHSVETSWSTLKCQWPEQCSGPGWLLHGVKLSRHRTRGPNERSSVSLHCGESS